MKLPSSLEIIGKETFKDCISLEPFLLPANLREIGNAAFKNCEKVTAISIPGTVKSIGSEAFADISLTSLYLEDSTEDININISCFGEKEVVIGYDEYHSWPEYGYEPVPPTQITSIYLGRNVIYGGADSRVSMLGKCHLDNFTMPSDLKVIPAYFFSGWTEANWEGIESFKMPWSVEKLGKECFYNCRGLKETLLPPSVNKIGQNAFSGSSLSKLSVMSPEPPECPYLAFDSKHYTNVELIVPTESVDLYRSQAPWSYFANISGSDFTSVEEVIATDDASVEWYDMNGRKVSGENMPAGIYLRRQGKKVEKTIIR